MLRRSKSSSNIPVPSSHKNKVREGSNPRASHRGSYVVQPAPKRTTSLDRKSSLDPTLTRTCLFTPTTTTKAKTSQKFRPNSLVGATPRTTPNHKSKQKLINDRAWVAKQYAKVQNFIQVSGLFDPQKANPGNIKPPTIGTFIYVCTVLLKEIFPNIKIDNANYKDVVPTHMKLLKYNGVMTNSILKAVNMPNTFPHVMSMFSFLIDCISMSNDILDPENFPANMRQLYKLKDLFLKHNIRDYADFQNNCSVCSEEIIKEYKKEIVEIMDIDMDKFEEDKQILERNTKQMEGQELKIAELKEGNDILKKEIRETETKIDEIEEYLDYDEHSLTEEMRVLRSDIEKLRNKEEDIEKEIRQLEETVAHQVCSYETKRKLQMDIGDLKRQVPLKRDKANEMMKIKEEFDYKTMVILDQIRSEVYRWNSSIMKASISNPDVKKLALRERNFTAESFDQEIHDIFENKLLIEKTNKTRLNEMKNEIDRIEELILCKGNELKVLTKQVEVLTEEIEKKKRFLTEEEIQLKQLLEKHNNEEKTYKEKLQKLANNTELDDLKKTVDELETKRQKMKQELMKLSKKCLNFFLDLNNIMVKKLNEMDSVINDVRKDLTETFTRLVEQKNQKLQILNSLNLNTDSSKDLL